MNDDVPDSDHDGNDIDGDYDGGDDAFSCPFCDCDVSLRLFIL